MLSAKRAETSNIKQAKNNIMKTLTLNYEKAEDLSYYNDKVVAGNFFFIGHENPFWISVREELPEGGIEELCKSMGRGFLNQKSKTITMHDRDMARAGMIGWDEVEKLTQTQLSANRENFTKESRGWDNESNEYGRDLNR